MAAWLVIDWDQDHFHVLSAQTTRGGVKVTRAVSWPHPEPFTPSAAERVGKALREFLKTERFASAPVLFGVGRDRVFMKEFRFPPIAVHEEAGLVRFQTGKELTESIENYAVDYVHLQKDGERQVMSVAVRRRGSNTSSSSTKRVRKYRNRRGTASRSTSGWPTAIP